MIGMNSILIPSPYLYRKRKGNCFGQVRVYDFLKNESTVVSPELSLLLERSAAGVSALELTQKYPPRLIDEGIRLGYLMERGEVWNRHALQAVEIETSTLCNWRCEYCPTRFWPRTPASMPAELFSSIIQKIALLDDIRYVALHFYNEPTIDPLFRWRVQELTRHGLALSLSTNGEALCSHMVDFLKSQKVYAVTINFPAAGAKRFEQATGSKQYDRTVRHIHYALDSGLPVRLSVPTGRCEEVKALFGLSGEQIASFETVDRAGLLQNEYSNHVDLHGRQLCGCILLNQRMYMNLRGELVMCCQDYRQTSVYGSIADGPLDETFGRGLQWIRRQAHSAAPAPDGFLCWKCQIMKSNLSRLRFMIPYGWERGASRSGAG